MYLTMMVPNTTKDKTNDIIKIPSLDKGSSPPGLGIFYYSISCSFYIYLIILQISEGNMH